MIAVRLTRPDDFDALGARWRALEARAYGSFFQSWTWTGCLAAERFPDPILIEATEAGETVGLALANRRPGLLRGALHWGEAGDPGLDGIYIEHNGPLTLAGREAEAARAMIAAASARYDLVLNGLDESGMAAAQAVAGVLIRKSAPAPFLDLAAVRRAGGDHLMLCAANTRQQIRRSDRAYAACGAVRIRRAASIEEASVWLDDMARLHQATWSARGRDGAFAAPFFGRFHHALIRRGLPRGEIDLLRVTAGSETVGILYNFRYGGRAMAYQSGFAYSDAHKARKPGMTSHSQAIQYSMAEGADIYDFLAGGDRYKRSLATHEAGLHWVLAGPAWAPRLLAGRAAAWVKASLGALRGRGA